MTIIVFLIRIYSIVGRLEKSKNNIIEVKFPLRDISNWADFAVSGTHFVVIPNPLRPKSEHTPEWNKHTKEVGNQEQGLCA